ESRRPAAPGAGTAGHRGRPATGRGGQDGGPRPRPRRAGGAALHLAARFGAADASSIERALCGDDHSGRVGLQPLARARGHALAPPASDAAHPVFSNLFVHTEADPALNTLLATRRPRSPENPPVWAAHVVAVDEHRVGGIQYETDRARFLGRGGTVRTPISVIDGRPLSNTAGPVLDPIF